jgi:hypothetical protein
MKKTIDIIYVSYGRRVTGIKIIGLILRIMGMCGILLVIENKQIKNNDDSNMTSKYWKKINGSNYLQDFSGYREGLNYVKENSDSQGIIFANDTMSRHRFFWGSFIIGIIIKLIYIKYGEPKKGYLIGELTGYGIRDSLYGQKTVITFSSFFFIIDKLNAINFFDKYFYSTCEDIELDNNNQINSRTKSISSNYILALNGYLGFNQGEGLGIWYRAKSASNKIKLDKAKCLVLERIIPTFVMNRGGSVNCFYNSKLLRILRSIEARVFYIRPKEQL